MIEGGTAGSAYNFGPVALFWLGACLVSFILPVIGWNHLRR